MKTNITIRSLNTISCLGQGKEVEEKYENNKTSLSYQKEVWSGTLETALKEEIREISKENSKYAQLDSSVLMGIYVARKAFQEIGDKGIHDIGINFGSSRGATETFENHHKEFLNLGKTHILTSPTTTLGNISSWIAADLGSSGPSFSHSITCSTALHAILNGVAWIESGRCSDFLAGGSEAPLTPFTIAQMRALKIYTRANAEEQFPCASMKWEKKENSMVLGEGAGAVYLSKNATATGLGQIIGLGYATEPIHHHVSISEDAQCLQASMRMALKDAHLDKVDAVVMHAPGTIKGDLSEKRAVEKVFDDLPYLVSNKWKIGHTFGASGMFNLELALLLLQGKKVAPPPWDNQAIPKEINHVMINAVGFGGNAVSILLSK